MRLFRVMLTLLLLASPLVGGQAVSPDGRRAETPATPERAQADAQEALGTVVRISTAGRGSFQGRVLSVLEDRVELVTADGQIIQIALSEIESVERLHGDDRRKVLYQDAAANRLVVMPTGFPMERGELHVSDQELAVVTASYGATDAISLWGGISIPGLVLSGRYSFMPAESLALSSGLFVGAEWFGFTTFLFPYALASFGAPNRNVTVGGGSVFAFFGEASGKALEAAVFAIGGKTIITSTAALVAESWTVWPAGTESLFFTPALVFRVTGSRLSWDLGGVVPLSLDWSGKRPGFGGIADDTVVPLPLLSVTYRID